MVLFELSNIDLTFI